LVDTNHRTKKQPTDTIPIKKTASRINGIEANWTEPSNIRSIKVGFVADD